MGHLLWPLALVVTFFVGLAAGRAVWHGQSAVQEAHEQETVSRLEQQVTALKARLRAREDVATAPAGTPSAVGSGPGAAREQRVVGARSPDDLAFIDNVARAGGAMPRPGASQTDRVPSPPGSPASTPTVQTALERFYRFLEATNGVEGRERWQQMRELIKDLRGMGDAGGQALMHVLAAGTDTDERRTAAHLLGQLQVSQALPLLRDIIEKEQDLLLRRAAASGLRQLQTPESVPVMERIVTNPNEDRFVRLSAASGLAQAGKPLGVSGLTHIFDESTGDGRGREMAFRVLASLNDERPLPFMRQVVTSHAEPGYRLRAIRYLTAQGDRQALAGLQVLMHSPNEQPSIRDAAAQAYTAISRR